MDKPFAHQNYAIKRSVHVSGLHHRMKFLASYTINLIIQLFDMHLNGLCLYQRCTKNCAIFSLLINSLHS